MAQKLPDQVPLLPDIVMTRLTPELVDATVECILEARHDRHVFHKALGITKDEFRPYCTWLVKQMFIWPKAVTNVALNTKTGDVVGTALYCDYCDAARVYSGPHQTPKMKQWSDCLLYAHKRLIEQNPKRFANLQRGELSYVAFITTRPEYEGKKLAGNMAGPSTLRVAAMGYIGGVSASSHPATVAMANRILSAKLFPATTVRIPWREFERVLRDPQSPVLRIRAPPHIVMWAADMFVRDGKREPNFVKRMQDTRERQRERERQRRVEQGAGRSNL